MSDRALRRLTAATVLLVALIAAVVSYEHLYHLSITHGEPRLDAALIPIATDGTVVAASLVMLRAARLGLPTPWLARLMLVLSVATTLAANMAFGWPFAVWGIILAGAPVVWFIGNAESVIAFGRKARIVPAGASVPASAGRKLPPLREIQERQSCGQRAAEVARAEVQLDRRSRGGYPNHAPAPAAQDVPAGERVDRSAPAGAQRSRGAKSAPTTPPVAAPAGNSPLPAGAQNGQAHG